MLLTRDELVELVGEWGIPAAAVAACRDSGRLVACSCGCGEYALADALAALRGAWAVPPDADARASLDRLRAARAATAAPAGRLHVAPAELPTLARLWHVPTHEVAAHHARLAAPARLGQLVAALEARGWSTGPLAEAHLVCLAGRAPARGAGGRRAGGVAPGVRAALAAAGLLGRGVAGGDVDGALRALAARHPQLAWLDEEALDRALAAPAGTARDWVAAGLLRQESGRWSLAQGQQARAAAARTTPLRAAAAALAVAPVALVRLATLRLLGTRDPAPRADGGGTTALDWLVDPTEAAAALTRERALPAPALPPTDAALAARAAAEPWAARWTADELAAIVGVDPAGLATWHANHLLQGEPGRDGAPRYAAAHGWAAAARRPLGPPQPPLAPAPPPVAPAPVPAPPARFGVEIECTLPAIAALTAALAAEGLRAAFFGYTHARTGAWKIVTDSSIGALPDGHVGCELVSPPLAGAAGLAAVARACRALAACGAAVNATCGLHVHHDAGALDLDALRALLAVHRDCAGALEGALAPGRRAAANPQCAAWTADERQRLARARSLEDVAAAADRHRALNLQALTRHGTVEFRQHEGTLDPAAIAHWVALTGALVAAAAAGARPRAATAAALAAALELGPDAARYWAERDAAAPPPAAAAPPAADVRPVRRVVRWVGDGRR